MTSQHAHTRIGSALATAVILNIAVNVGANAAEPRAAQRPEVIVVTSSLIETPLRQLGTAVSVIEGPGLQLRGYDSLADALRTQPGIAVSNAGGPGKNTVLRVRGEEHYRTLLMIDGVKAADPSAPQVAPSFDNLLSTSDLERVEILRGPQGFIYGADAGGVVSAITARGEGPLGGRLGVEYGAFATQRYEGSASGGSDQGDYFVSFTDYATDGFNAQTADTLADDDGADNTTLHAKLGWNVNDALRLQLVARDIDAAADYDGCFDTITFATIHDCAVATQQRTYKVSANYDQGRLTHTVGYSNVDIARDNFAAGVSAFASTGAISRFEYTGSYRGSDSMTLVYGVDLQNEELIADETLERDQDGYYVEYQGRFADAFFVSVGTRRDDSDDFGSHTSTRVSGAYVQDLSAAHSLKYRASFGTGFRAPSLYETAYNHGPFASSPAADLTLTEESSRGYDVGIEYDNAAGLHLEATYFDQTIEDELFFDLTAYSGYLQSPGTSASTGIELAATAPLSARWSLLANWTHNHTTDRADDQRLRRPEQMGNLGVRFSSEDDQLRLIANYRLARDSVDIGGLALDDYETLDVSLAYAFNPTFELYARVENLADQSYQEVRGFNTAGRSVYTGVRFRLR